MHLNKILVAFDGSHTGEAALRAAIELASGRSTEIHAVHVRKRHEDPHIPPHEATGGIDPAYEILERLHEEEALGVERRITEIATESGVSVVVHQRTGDPRNKILALARTLDAGLLVLGSRGHGTFDKLLLGSVSSYIVEHSPISTLVVRSRTAETGN
jgi:nucleotide-binding universal stress UspA family protein